jgi:hypothetical protein
LPRLPPFDVAPAHADQRRIVLDRGLAGAGLGSRPVPAASSRPSRARRPPARSAQSETTCPSVPRPDRD